MTAPCSQPRIANLTGRVATRIDTCRPDAPLPGPVSRAAEPDDIANDNAMHCRRSGVAIDPMFLN